MQNSNLIKDPRTQSAADKKSEAHSSHPQTETKKQSAENLPSQAGFSEPENNRNTSAVENQSTLGVP